MKVGVRKPSLKKSVKARTTGKTKRAIKKATIPGYGQKGMGYINNPKKAVYNKVYNKTTVGIDDLISAHNSTSNIEFKSDKTEVSGIGAIFAFIGALIKLIVAIIQMLFGLAIFITFIWLIIKLIF